MNNTWKFVIIFILLLSLSFSSALFSCGDDDDDDDGGFMSECDYSEQDPCELNLGCTDVYDFGFESVIECREEIIKPLLDSENPCEQAAGECLNTIEQYGPDEAGACERIQPETCEEAGELWSECLALAEQEEC